jgi:hypothetical protein
MRIFRNGLTAAVFGLMIGQTGPARADILLELINAPVQFYTPYALPFTASAATTTVSIGGYEPPADEGTTHNGLFLDGSGPNLLGSAWVFTPALQGSDASPFSDGTSVPALAFGGTVAGDYDTFSQTISTTPGQSYTLDFLYSNGPISGAQSGFLVTTSDTTVVPEPSTFVIAAIGLASVCCALWPDVVGALVRLVAKLQYAASREPASEPRNRLGASNDHPGRGARAPEGSSAEPASAAAAGELLAAGTRRVVRRDGHVDGVTPRNGKSRTFRAVNRAASFTVFYGGG